MTSEQQPRSIRSLVFDPTFGPYLFSSILSASGTWIQNIAAAVTMFALTGSATMVASVSMVQFAAPVVLAIWAGALTDRVDRRRLFRTGRIISTSGVSMLAALLWVRGVDGFGGPPVLLAAILVMGVGLAVSAPARQALVPALVPERDLEQALALTAVIPSISRSAGPALGAALLVVGGPALAFTVAAVSHLLLVVVLTVIRGRPVVLPRRRPAVWGGLRYAVGNRNVGLLLVALALLGFGGDPVITLTPSLVEQLGGGEGSVGLLAAFFGIGGGLVPLALPRLRRRFDLRRIGVAGFWLAGSGLAVVAIAGTLPIAALGFAVAGTGFLAGNVILTTRIQRRVPEELRGRVMALHGIAWFGSRPAVAFVNGLIADTVSVPAALATSTVVLFIASALANRPDAAAG